MGEPTRSGALTAASLISGTTNVSLNVVFYTLVLLGHVLLWKRSPLWGRILSCTTALYVVVLIATRPWGIGTGLVLVRYMIVVVPIALIGIAHALDEVDRLVVQRAPGEGDGGVRRIGPPTRRGTLRRRTATGAPTPSERLHGPLGVSRGVRPSAMGSIGRASRPTRPSRAERTSFRLSTVSSAVSRTSRPSSSYPFDVCNHNNLYYFYQHVHGKRVLAGYCSDPSRVGVTVAPRRGPRRRSRSRAG
jgi:hypothetical protein